MPDPSCGSLGAKVVEPLANLPRCACRTMLFRRVDRFKFAQRRSDPADDRIPLSIIGIGRKMNVEFVAPARDFLLTSSKCEVAQFEEPGFKNLRSSGKLRSIYPSWWEDGRGDLDWFGK